MWVVLLIFVVFVVAGFAYASHRKSEKDLKSIPLAPQHSKVLSLDYFPFLYFFRPLAEHYIHHPNHHIICFTLYYYSYLLFIVFPFLSLLCIILPGLSYPKKHSTQLNFAFIKVTTHLFNLLSPLHVICTSFALI